ncbi:MAG: efflux RND transporter periplasmic adaptor subunit [Bryobacterales bacterium]|nr:efflux RND transporter periplasmic adaptor subunit [Bryobacterales bacterium]
MKKRLLPLILIAAAAAGYFLYRTRQVEATDTIRVSGNIELTEVKIAFKTAGRLVELAFDEGDAVEKGALVARLDTDQLERHREREAAGLTASQSLLAQSRTALAFQREAVDAEVALRQATLEQVQARVRELESGSRPREIDEAHAAVEAVRADAERARRDWERAQVLHARDDISTSQFDQFRARFSASQAALQQAVQRLALLEEGPREEAIEAAQAQAASARAAVRLAEAQRIEIRRREQEVATRQAESERARAQLHLVEAQIGETVAVAPVSGVVLVRPADLGEVLAAGATVLTIGDLDHPWLRGYIDERDLGRVSLGAKVHIKTDSFPGKIYNGRISFIASEAEFTPKQIQTEAERVKLVYRVKIDVENPNRELKLNMPADAEIVLEP